MEDNTLDNTESFDLEEEENEWDDPEKVSWYNIKTGRSKDKGVAVTHDGNFKVCSILMIDISH